MNLDVFLLFFNIMLTVLLASGIVLWILRREYLPVIRRLERDAEGDAAAEERADSRPGTEE